MNSTDQTQSPPDAPPNAREERIRDIVSDYVDRLKCGEPADLTELLVLHLSIVQEVEQRIEAATLLHRLAESQRAAAETLDTVSSAPASVDGAAPSFLGRYQVLGLLGRGASAEVYRAHDPKLRRDVALKVLRADRNGPDAAHFFEHDARILAQLRHPNIVLLHEIGEHAGRSYIDMELIEGETLETRLRAGPLPPRSAAELVRKIAQTLQHAHEAGVIHRDLKPSNILLRQPARDGADAEPLLADFGLARWLDSASIVEGGRVVGTLAYMSPEQAQGRSDQTDARSDVYGLGVILYQALTGRLPFEAASPGEMLAAVLHRPTPPPRTRNAAIPPDLELICLKAMEKEPADRFATADALADELGRWLHGDPLTVRPPTLWERLRRWARRHRLVAVVIAVALILLFVQGAVMGWSAWDAHERAHQVDLGTAQAESKRREAEIREIVTAQSRAEVEALALLQRSRQHREKPVAGRRTEAIAYARAAAKSRQTIPKGEVTDRLDLAIRSAFAGALCVPDVATPEEANLPQSDRPYPVALHPDGKSLVLGVRPRPVLWKFGEPLQVPAGSTDDNSGKLLCGPRLVYSPNAHYLAAIPRTGGLEIWDETLTHKTDLDPERSVPYVAVGFDRESKKLCACRVDGMVRCWSLPELTLADTWDKDDRQTAMVWSGTFTADLSLLIVGDLAGQARLRRPHQKTQFLFQAGSPVTALALSPDERIIAAGSKDGVLRTWRFEGDRLVPRYLRVVAGEEITSIVFHPDGELLLAGGRGGMKAWDAAGGEPVLTGPLTPVGFSRDGRRFAGTSQSVVGCCELLMPRVLRLLRGHQAHVSSLSWSRDGRHLATLDESFQIGYWDMEHSRPLRLFPAPPGTVFASNAATALSDDGRLLAYANGGESRLLIWDMVSGEKRGEWHTVPGFNRLACVGGQRFRLVSEEMNTEANHPPEQLRTIVREFEPDKAPSEPRELRSNDEGEKMFFYSQLSADGGTYTWSGPRWPPKDYRVEVWDVVAGRRIARIPVPDTQERSSVGFLHSPDGRFLWSDLPNKESRLRDVAAAEDLGITAKRPTAVSPERRWSAYQYSVGPQREVPVVALKRGSEEQVWLELENKDLSDPNPVVFSRDGRFLAWGNLNGGVTLADLEALAEEVAAFEKSLTP